MMIDQIVNAGAAPFMEQVGWQGFAYGLLGLRTIRRVVDTARSIYENRRSGGGNSGGE